LAVIIIALVENRVLKYPLGHTAPPVMEIDTSQEDELAELRKQVEETHKEIERLDALAREKGK